MVNNKIDSINYNVLGLAASSLISLLLGFFIFDKEHVSIIFYRTGYYFIFITTILWVVNLIPEKNLKEICLNWFHDNLIAIVFSILLMFGMYLSCSPQFRILADETNLASIAYSMYREKEFFNSTSGFNIYDSYNNIHHVWGTRPLFFPFLVNIIHTLTGYRAENVFFLNAIGGMGTLLVFYSIVRLWYSKFEAIMGMLLLASFPVIVLCITSGGFEILNLFFILISFYLLINFFQNKTSKRLERLILTLILLSQIRYESVIFLIILLLIFIVLFFRYDEFRILSKKILFFPFLLLPIAWQRSITMSSEQLIGNLEVESDVFSLTGFGSKIFEFFSYFSTNSYSHNTIPIIFYIGLIGLAFGFIKFLKNYNDDDFEKMILILYSFLTLFFLFLIINLYNQPQGGISHPTTIRLGIIYLPILVFGTVIIISELFKHFNFNQQYFIVIPFCFLLWYWPIAKNNHSVNTLVISREYKSILSFLNANYQNNNLIIVTTSPGLYTPHNWGSVYFQFAIDNKNELIEKLKTKLVQEILVIQNIDLVNLMPTKETELNINLKLEKVFEMRESGDYFIRISRIIVE